MARVVPDPGHVAAVRGRGRPRKFPGPSRAVTLTLPVPVIDALSAIDADISRAVVRVAQPELSRRRRAPAELAVFGRRSVIVITPSRTLERRMGVELVPLPDGRALISFDRSVTPASLELRITDALDGDQLNAGDREIFRAIADILRTARRSADVMLKQPNIIMLEARRRTTRKPAAPEPVRSRRG
ncbi:MAG: hypothetical protein ABIX28_06865 [Vicinamibacterales bacterium]